MAVKVSVAPLWHDCEEVQTDEASPELGGLDRDIPERFLQVPVLGPDRVDRSRRHPLLKASPRRDQVESVRLAAARGELAQSPGRLAGRGGISASIKTVVRLERYAGERARESAAAGGFHVGIVIPHYNLILFNLLSPSPSCLPAIMTPYSTAHMAISEVNQTLANESPFPRNRRVLAICREPRRNFRGTSQPGRRLYPLRRSSRSGRPALSSVCEVSQLVVPELSAVAGTVDQPVSPERKSTRGRRVSSV